MSDVADLDGLQPGEGERDAQGRRHGPWREFDPHGGDIAGEYVHGVRNGAWRHYFADGRVRSEMHYEGGELTGPATWHRATGGLLQRGAFLDGKKHGRWTRWNAAGTLIDEGEFVRGVKTGEWTYYHPDGTVKKVTQHRG